jgi:hypothetical protein
LPWAYPFNITSQKIVNPQIWSLITKIWIRGLDAFTCSFCLLILSLILTLGWFLCGDVHPGADTWTNPRVIFFSLFGIWWATSAPPLSRDWIFSGFWVLVLFYLVFSSESSVWSLLTSGRLPTEEKPRKGEPNGFPPFLIQQLSMIVVVRLFVCTKVSKSIPPFLNSARSLWLL